ncbi:MAG: NF038122 family metalloprotease [Acetobacteraceae bacterium]
MRQARLALGMGVLGLGVSALPAQALVISPIFDASIIRLPNAAVVEQAFRTAASAYDAAISSPAVVNVNVSWGKVGGYALPSGALGASIDPLYGYFNYSQIKSWLPATDVLPPTPAAVNRYVLPSAEAKALGLLPAKATASDGYIGFGLAPANYSFTAATTKAGTYNFIDVAEHELDEVLGRISGIGDGFATPFDLFRYTRIAAGKPAPSFSATATAYFSVNGGATQDGPPFNSTRSGDRGDWYTTPASTDIQDAFLYPGTTPFLSPADLDGLRVLGWTTGGNPYQQLVARAGAAHFALVAEPASIALFGAALAMLVPWTARRRRLAPA